MAEALLVRHDTMQSSLTPSAVTYLFTIQH